MCKYEGTRGIQWSYIVYVRGDITRWKADTEFGGLRDGGI